MHARPFLKDPAVPPLDSVMASKQISSAMRCPELEVQRHSVGSTQCHQPFVFWFNPHIQLVIVSHYRQERQINSAQNPQLVVPCDCGCLRAGFPIHSF